MQRQDAKTGCKDWRMIEEAGAGLGNDQSQSLRIDEAWTAVCMDVCKSRREEGGEAAASTYLLFACALRGTALRALAGVGSS